MAPAGSSRPSQYRGQTRAARSPSKQPRRATHRPRWNFRRSPQSCRLNLPAKSWRRRCPIPGACAEARHTLLSGPNAALAWVLAAVLILGAGLTMPSAKVAGRGRRTGARPVDRRTHVDIDRAAGGQKVAAEAMPVRLRVRSKPRPAPTISGWPARGDQLRRRRQDFARRHVQADLGWGRRCAASRPRARPRMLSLHHGQRHRAHGGRQCHAPDGGAGRILALSIRWAAFTPD